MTNATAEKLQQDPASLPEPQPAPPDVPVDHHPDGTPMSQAEIDEHWLKHVYKPQVPQLTVRAVVTGMLLGGALSIINLYVGLKIGWGLGITVTAAVLAYGLFSLLRVFGGPFAKEFTSLENNTMASAASAAGYFAGSGLTSAIPALTLTTGHTLAMTNLALWILLISALGVFLAVPMRRQMIDVERLPFPEGLAYAETIRALHAAPGEARKKTFALLWSSLASGILAVLSGLGKITEQLPIFGQALLKRSLSLPTDPLMIGAGAMMGMRVCSGLLIGALMAWGVLGPWLFQHGLAGTGATFETTRTWVLWPGVAIVVVNGLLAFGLKWRTALEALRSIGQMVGGKKTSSGMADVEVPSKWFAYGTLGCTILITFFARVFFDIPVWLGLLSVVFSALLSIVACRATGETSVTPTGPLGKITQFMYGGLARGNVQTNLMAASVTAGAAMHSADLLTDLKGGYMLGARPRYQFIAQFCGLLAGAVFCVPAYRLLAQPETLGTVKFPAPSAMTWKAVAEFLSNGLDHQVRGQTVASPMTVPAIPVSYVPPTARFGGVSVKIVGGPNEGVYGVAFAADKWVILDRAPKEMQAGAGAIVDFGDGKQTKMTGSPAMLPAALLDHSPGTMQGDYLKLISDDHRDYWWPVKGAFGGVVILDRPLQGKTTVEVRKESLPPFVPRAILIAVLAAFVLTLLETYAPKSVRSYIPSTTGIGLAFVISGSDSISMFIGALLAWIFSKVKAKTAEEYTLTIGSGIMAGSSIMGIFVILYEVLHH